jgi:transposase
MNYVITDEVRAVLSPMVDRSKSPVVPGLDLPDWTFFEAVLYWARVGCRRNGLPAEFGKWSTFHTRWRRWVASGRLKRISGAVEAQPDCKGLRRIMIDSTIVRTLQH